MPELAEVEFFRKQWDVGMKQRIVAVDLHAGKRIFRGVKTPALQRKLTGAKLVHSQTHGKQMVFKFTGNLWLGIHLGMTGKLQAAESADGKFTPAKHDHLVLRQPRRSLIFSDPRQFGRVLFYDGPGEPPWWSKLPPELLSKQFTRGRMEDFLRRHRGAPIKAVLLMQAGFPGIGNWMADEILWQAGIHPRTAAGKLPPAMLKKLHPVIKSVTRTALKTIGANWGDPPRGWLIHRRWRRGGNCPKDGAALRHATIGGRTTCWCPKCQV